MRQKSKSNIRLLAPSVLAALMAVSLGGHSVQAAETETAGQSVDTDALVPVQPLDHAATGPVTDAKDVDAVISEPLTPSETTPSRETESGEATASVTAGESVPVFTPEVATETREEVKPATETGTAAPQTSVAKEVKTAEPVATGSTRVVSAVQSSTGVNLLTAETTVQASALAVTDSNVATRSAAAPLAADSNQIINVTPVWNKDYKGEGMVVAVIDSGLDVDHEVLRLSNVATAKYKTQEEIEAAKAAAGINYGQWYNDKVVFGYNYTDVNNELKETKESSHGMHVSGISVGNPEGTHSSGMKITGVAPEAQLMFMRVFSDDRNPGTTNTLLYARAIEDAVKLGADAINLSLGSANGSLNDIEDHLGRAIAAARKAGVAVVIAAGNDTVFGDGKELPYATNPDYGVVGNPSTARDSISVAAINNTHLTHVVGNILGMEDNEALNNGKFTFTKASNSRVDFPSDKEYDYVYVNLGKEEDFEGLDLTGKIALIKRGEITFANKILNAKNAKAAGVVVFNNQSTSGSFTMSVDDGRVATTPTAFISKEFGEELAAKAGTGQYKIAFANNYESVEHPGAGQMAEFSSWGLSADGELKPDVTAPGGGIFSSVNDNQYDSEDGTSMASPHIAGVVTLMKQALVNKYPDLTPEELQVRIKQLLMSTANPHFNTETGAYTSPRSQGAGVADTDKAISSDLYVTGLDDLSSISLGNVKEKFVVTTRLYNTSNEAKTVNYIAHLNTDHVADGRFTLTPRELSQKTGSVTVAANSSTLISIVLDSSDYTNELSELMPNGYYLEGFVRFVDAVDGGDLVSIPFVGFKGEFQNLDVLEKPVYDFDVDNGDLPFYMDRDEEATEGALTFTESGEDYTSLITSVAEYDHIKGEYTPESAIIAGTYLNKPTEGEYILHRDENGQPYIAISPSEEPDHNRDVVLFRGVFLRNYSNLVATVYAADDTERENPIWSSTPVSGEKNFWAGRATNPKSTIHFETAWDGRNSAKTIVPDGNYVYVVTYQPDVPGANHQEVSFNVIVDTQRPAITTAVIDKAERTFKPRPSLVYGSTEIYREMVYYNIDAEAEPTEDGSIPNNTVRHYIEPDENGVYHLPTHDVNGEELSFSDFWYRVETRAGNSLAASLGELLTTANDYGIVAFGLQNKETGDLIEGADLRYIIRDKDGNRVTDTPKDGPTGNMYALPFGDYTVELILHDEDAAYLVDERIKSFSVTEDKTLQPVYFDTIALKRSPFSVTFDVPAPAGTKIYLVDSRGKKTELPQGRYTPELFGKNLVTGAYTVTVEVPEGYTVSETEFSYTIDTAGENNKDLTLSVVLDFDHDGDGFTTAEELAAGTDPFDKDTYPASLPNLYTDYPGRGDFDPSLDQDGDGFTSEVELRVGTDPLDVNSFPFVANKEPGEQAEEWVSDAYVDGTPGEVSSEWVSDEYVDGTPGEVSSEWVNDAYVDGTPGEVSSEWVSDEYVDGTPGEVSSEWVNDEYVDGTPGEVKSEWVNDEYVDGTPGEVSSEWVGDAYVDGTPGEVSSEWVGDAYVDGTPGEVSSEWVGDAYVDGTPGEVSSEWVGDAYVDGTPGEVSSEWVNDEYVDGTPGEVSSEWVNDEYVDGTPGEVSSEWVSDEYVDGTPGEVSSEWVDDAYVSETDEELDLQVSYLGDALLNDDKPFFDVTLDHDGDGFTSEEELYAGTDPLDATSFPFVANKEPGEQSEEWVDDAYVSETDKELTLPLTNKTKVDSVTQTKGQESVPARPAGPARVSAKQSLPSTGDASSHLALLGMGLALAGFALNKRRKGLS